MNSSKHNTSAFRKGHPNNQAQTCTMLFHDKQGIRHWYSLSTAFVFFSDLPQS
jgi:hypothetical protein